MKLRANKANNPRNVHYKIDFILNLYNHDRNNPQYDICCFNNLFGNLFDNSSYKMDDGEVLNVFHVDHFFSIPFIFIVPYYFYYRSRAVKSRLVHNSYFYSF